MFRDRYALDAVVALIVETGERRRFPNALNAKFPIVIVVVAALDVWNCVMLNSVHAPADIPKMNRSFEH